MIAKQYVCRIASLEFLLNLLTRMSSGLAIALRCSWLPWGYVVFCRFEKNGFLFFEENQNLHQYGFFNFI